MKHLIKLISVITVLAVTRVKTFSRHTPPIIKHTKINDNKYRQ